MNRTHSKERFREYFQHYNLPEIDEVLYPFITIVEKKSKDAEIALNEMDQTINLAETLSLNCGDDLKRFVFEDFGEIVIKDEIQTCEDILFIYEEINRVQRELIAFTEKHFSKYSAILSRLTCYLIACKENNIPVYVNFKHLREYIEVTYKGNIEFFQKSNELQRLKSHFLVSINYPKYPTAPLMHLQLIAHDVSQNADEILEYILPNYFDDFLWIYIVTNHDAKIFDAAIDEAIQNKSDGKIMLDKASLEVIKYIKIFQPKNINEIVVYRTSLFRFLFDRLYIKYEIPENQEENDRFYTHCNMVIKSTPRKLEMTQKFIKDSELDSPLCEIFHNNSKIQACWDSLSEIHFYTNPLDIMNSIYLSIKACEDYMKDNFIANLKGAAANELEGISFDDFFSVFRGVVAVSPPANAVTIKNFLNTFDGFRISSHFDYSRAVFVSTVEELVREDYSKLL